MQRERPPIILVMAILNFVFGTVCGGLYLCGLGSLAFMNALSNVSMPPGPKGTPNPLVEISTMYDYIPGFYAVTITYSVVGMILQLALIFAGVGLLYMKPWARWTCV